MATLRFQALGLTLSRTAQKVEQLGSNISDIFCESVFDDVKMRKFLSKEAYSAVKMAIEKGTRIERKAADQVASAMKAWAMEKGASHFTHWFHPLTGGTAEKHDAFFDFAGPGQFIEKFSGDNLAQAEPDASSFPSGGLRATFEARGYTAWDPSSPVFLIGSTLCIPTVFISYTGEALDYKTPLLKATAALDKAAVDVCQYFDKDINKVYATLGWEQEYFLIDEALASARPDLMMCDRTLTGHVSAKNQQLEDQYFGSIPERVWNFMHDIEIESYKLGVPLRTRHNEVAPNQYEAAPIFEEANLANDHNLILMDVMRKVAKRHNFRVIFHEKPFKGINGSGKHNNFSMATNTGVNLLSPGKNPKSNMLFLVFLVNTLKAVHKHASLLKASIASASNAHRLGANEAPPAIISAFLGAELTRMLNEIEDKVTSRKMTAEEKTALKLDVGRIPEILLDNTDRNRTSPFAFTGNRFEFRAVGSSANNAGPISILSAAITEALVEFKKDVDALINKGTKKDEAIFQVLRKYIIDSKNIRFDGNNYSDEWKAEAKRRGLDVEVDVPTMFGAYLKKESLELFKKTKILSESEVHSRVEVMYETYIKKVQIEGRVLSDMAINHIIPVALQYQNVLIQNVKGLKEIFGDDYKKMAGEQISQIKEISEHCEAIKKLVADLSKARAKANEMDAHKGSVEYSKVVFPFLEKIREHVDALELSIDDEYWPLPKYREMLFTR